MEGAPDPLASDTHGPTPAPMSTGGGALPNLAAFRYLNQPTLMTRLKGVSLSRVASTNLQNLFCFNTAGGEMTSAGSHANSASLAESGSAKGGHRATKSGARNSRAGSTSVDSSATHAAVDGHGQEKGHAGPKKAPTLGKMKDGIETHSMRWQADLESFVRAAV